MCTAALLLLYRSRAFEFRPLLSWYLLNDGESDVRGQAGRNPRRNVQASASRRHSAKTRSKRFRSLINACADASAKTMTRDLDAEYDDCSIVGSHIIELSNDPLKWIGRESS